MPPFLWVELTKHTNKVVLDMSNDAQLCMLFRSSVIYRVYSRPKAEFLLHNQYHV